MGRSDPESGDPLAKAPGGVGTKLGEQEGCAAGRWGFGSRWHRGAPPAQEPAKRQRDSFMHSQLNPVTTSVRHPSPHLGLVAIAFTILKFASRFPVSAFGGP